jgi:hypothetical protein
MFAETTGGTMSTNLKPYFAGGRTTPATVALYKADTGDADPSSDIVGYVTTKAYEPGGPGFYGQVGDVMLLAKARASGTIAATITPDFGAATAKTASVTLIAVSSETRVERRIEDSTLSGFQFFQWKLQGTGTPSFALERLVIPFTPHEAASA